MPEQDFLKTIIPHVKDLKESECETIVPNEHYDIIVPPKRCNMDKQINEYGKQFVDICSSSGFLYCKWSNI